MEFKAVTIKGNVFLEGKTSKEEPLDESIASKLAAPPEWLIPCQVQKDLMGKQAIYYNITGKTVLSEYFATLYLPAGAIKALFKQFITVIDSAGIYQLPLKNVVFDYSQAYFDSDERQVKFIYLPIAGIAHNIYKIRDFFCELSAHVICADDAAVKLMADYSSFFQFNPYLSLVDFRNHLQALVEGRPVGAEAAAAAQAQATARQAPIAQKQVVMQVQAQIRQAKKPAALHQATGQQPRVSPRKTDSGTTVLGSSMAPAPAAPAPAPQRPAAHQMSCFLEPIGGGQRIDIPHDGFVIGKSATCDYQVTGNNAVSRRHARFLITGGTCSIEDLGSTNKTYVRGKAIAPGAPAPLSDGCRIKLANEEFVFHIAGGVQR